MAAFRDANIGPSKLFRLPCQPGRLSGASASLTISSSTKSAMSCSAREPRCQGRCVAKGQLRPSPSAR